MPKDKQIICCFKNLLLVLRRLSATPAPASAPDRLVRAKAISKCNITDCRAILPLLVLLHFQQELYREWCEKANNRKMKAPEASCEDVVNLLGSWCGGTACLSSLVMKEIKGIPVPAFYRG